MENFDIICISETWLAESDDGAIVRQLLPNNYRIHHVQGKNEQVGELTSGA